jgi:hypothetical protein
MLAAAALLAAAACGTEPTIQVAINVDRPPPDSTREATVAIGGRVVSASGGVGFAVRVDGGVAPVEVTTDRFGFWDLVVSVRRAQTNTLTVSAEGEDGTAEPVTLTVTHVSPLAVELSPDLRLVTNDATVRIAGSVTRTPRKRTPLVVTVSNGTESRADTATTDGLFAVDVPLLTFNAVNTLAVVASDTLGDSSAVLNVEVRHDDVPPSVVAIAPLGAGVTTDGAISVTFDEPVQGALGVVDGRWTGTTISDTLFSRAGQWTVIGGTDVSDDGRTLRFVPETSFLPGAVHEITVADVTDLAGNSPVDLPAPDACFITQDGSEDAAVFLPDASSDALAVAGATGAGGIPDVTGVHFGTVQASVGSIPSPGTTPEPVMIGRVEFADPVTIRRGDPGHVEVLLEFDLDRSAATGWRSVRDSLLSAHPAAASGTGWDRTLHLGTRIWDRPAFGQFVEENSVYRYRNVYVTQCRNVIGFVIPVRTVFFDIYTDDYPFSDFDVAIAAIVPENGASPVPVLRGPAEAMDHQFRNPFRLLDAAMIDAVPDAGRITVPWFGAAPGAAAGSSER